MVVVAHGFARHPRGLASIISAIWLTNIGVVVGIVLAVAIRLLLADPLVGLGVGADPGSVAPGMSSARATIS